MTTAELIQRLREACEEIRTREAEDLVDMADPNCYAAGYVAGAISAADELIACLDEEAIREADLLAARKLTLDQLVADAQAMGPYE